MLASVEVMPEAEFAAWLEQRRTEQTAGSGELGKETWEGVCAKCHGLSGEGGIGPKLAGSVALADPAAVEKHRPQRPAHDAGRRLGLDERAGRSSDELPEGEPARVAVSGAQPRVRLCACRAANTSHPGVLSRPHTVGMRAPCVLGLLGLRPANHERTHGRVH